MGFGKFLSSAALAFYALAGSANSEIYTRETLPVKPNNVDRAFDATFKLEKQRDAGLCTAVAVSPDGYFLTNLHCVMPCLAEKDLISREHFNPLMGREVNNGIVDVDIGFHYTTRKAWSATYNKEVEVVDKEQDYRITRVLDQTPENLFCENYMLTLGEEKINISDGTVYRTEQFFYKPRIVYLGRGNMVFSDENVSTFPDEIVSQLRKNQDDFAILKFELSGQINCMPMYSTEAKSGDTVWVIGYPMFASRDSGFHSPGSRKAASFGKVRGTVAEDVYLRNLTEDTDATGKPEPKLSLTVADWQRLQTIYESPVTLLTDLDALPGNSGSMIINNDGNVVALLHSGVTYSTKKHLGATVFGLKIDVLLDDVRKNLGEEKYGEIFSCEESIRTPEDK